MKKKKLLEKIVLCLMCFILAIPDIPLSAKRGEQSSEKNPVVSAPPNLEMESFPQPSADDMNTLKQTSSKAERPPIDDVFTVQEEVYQPSKEPSAILSIKAKTLKKQKFLNSAASQRSLTAKTKQSQDLSQSEIDSLVLAGASRLDVYWINLLRLTPSKWAPLELLKWKQKGNITWEQIQSELNGATSLNSEESSVQDSVYSVTEDILPLQQRPSVTSQVYVKDSNALNDLEITAATTTAFDLAVDSAFDGLIREAQINQTKKPQFEDRSGSSESVDPASGTLLLKKNLMNLPGRAMVWIWILD